MPGPMTLWYILTICFQLLCWERFHVKHSLGFVLECPMMLYSKFIRFFVTNYTRSNDIMVYTYNLLSAYRLRMVFIFETFTAFCFRVSNDDFTLNLSDLLSQIMPGPMTLWYILTICFQLLSWECFSCLKHSLHFVLECPMTIL